MTLGSQASAFASPRPGADFIEQAQDLVSFSLLIFLCLFFFAYFFQLNFRSDTSCFSNDFVIRGPYSMSLHSKSRTYNGA